jgi:hypothetical protein
MLIHIIRCFLPRCGVCSEREEPLASNSRDIFQDPEKVGHPFSNRFLLPGDAACLIHG